MYKKSIDEAMIPPTTFRRLMFAQIIIISRLNFIEVDVFSLLEFAFFVCDCN